MRKTKNGTAPHAVTLQALAGGAIAIADITAAELFDIDSVVEHPENPRHGDLDTITESIREHGIYRRLIVQRATPDGKQRMRVIAGNHTRRAAKELGYKKLPMEFVDCTDTKARKILLVDNRTNDNARYDDRALIELLAALQDDGSLVGTGYAGEDLEDLKTRLALPEYDEIAANREDESLADARGLVPIRVRVAPDVAARWRRFLEEHPGDSDGERFALLLTLAARAEA